MRQILTFIRHGAAVAAAWLVTTLTGLLGVEPDPETTAQVAEGLSSVGIAVFGLVYAWGEKLMKPVFRRLGEVQPGEDAVP